MQNESDEEKGSSGVVVQASGQTSVMEVQAASGQTLRVVVDGRVYWGNKVEVIEASMMNLAPWDELQPGFVYVDRDSSGKVSGVLQTAADPDGGKLTRWRWVWTPYYSTNDPNDGWYIIEWDTSDSKGADDNYAELVGPCPADDSSNDNVRKMVEAWAAKYDEKFLGAM